MKHRKEIKRSFPGKNAKELYEKLHHAMQEMASKHHLHYKTDPVKGTGEVGPKMGITGVYAAREGAVEVNLEYGIIGVPVAKQLVGYIEHKLDKLAS